MGHLAYAPFLTGGLGADTDEIVQEERLWVADPKAIHHILKVSSYQYQKPPHTRAQREAVVGRGLVSVEGELPLTFRAVKGLILYLGDVHKRQRRAMVPAFGLVEAKGLYPCFSRCSNSVSHCPAHT